MKPYISTELGREKLCICCKEYWPLDGEFWRSQWRNRKYGRVQYWVSACNGCYDFHNNRRRYAKDAQRMAIAG
jgi:hypothetical protein